VTSPAVRHDSAQPQGDGAILSWIEHQWTRATLKFAEWTSEWEYDGDTCDLRASEHGRRLFVHQ
jgi:hypothetical protein